MKNNFKKCLALLLSVVMILAMSVSVFATDNTTQGGKTNVAIAENAPTTGSLTIKNKTTDATYSIYKVFSASQAENAGTYTWTAEPAFEAVLGEKTAEDIAGMSADQLKTLATSLESAVTAPGSSIANCTDNLASLSLGYYLVVENGTMGLKKSQPILVALPQVQNNTWVYDITVSPKSSSTDFTKKIAENGNLVDTNTKKIGEYVDYRLWADIPTYTEASYEKNNLTFQITDTMSNQLTWGSESAISVYVLESADNATIATLENKTPIGQDENYTVSPTKIDKTFTVDFTNDFLKANKGKVVVVAFKAQLNESAIIGNAEGADLADSLGTGKSWKDDNYNQKGNPNAAKLTYTNDFDVTNNSGTDEIDDIVTTFTFDLEVKKIDKERDDQDNEVTLANAEFEVYTDAACTILYTNSWKVEGTTQTFDGKLKTGANGTVTAKGFKDGTYYIKETKAPAGYKLYEGVIKVDIVADEENENYTGDFSYTVQLGSYDSDAKNWIAESNSEAKEDLTIVTVEDEKGLTLPGTGGIGTTIFTVGGLALVVLAGVLFIVYMKKQKRQA